MSYNKTIYKVDTTGKVRFLTVRTEGTELIQESGVVGTANIVVHRSYCTPKNVGRANETTAEEQAILEAQSKVASKMTEGYANTEEEAKKTKVVLPMLAKDYKKESHKVDWSKPVFVQPKLDGMRALGGVGRPMISRQGKVIETMGHIQEEINTLKFLNILDGELYSHGRNFQENMRLIKKDRGAETQEVKYRVYDLVLPLLPFNSRYSILKGVVKDLKHIEIVPTYECKNEEELKSFHKQFLAEGYEGTIVRHGDDGYAVDARATQLLKYKDFIDITCTVMDILPSEKNPKQGVVQCKIITKDHVPATFGCGMKFSHAEREEILLNKDQYIGKQAEVRFFEYSEDGIPRFPVCHGFRLDK